MASLGELRAEARKHALKLDAIQYHGVQDLADRYSVDAETVKAIPRERLPYIALGKSGQIRRYDPRDVAQYEARAKAGEFDLAGGGEAHEQ